MNLKSIKHICKYTENDQEIICDFNGKRLTYLEKILSITKSKHPKIQNVNFFEFGSQEWNPSHFGPRSGINAHFMGAGTNLSYKCFDAYSEPIDFDANTALIKAYKQASKEEDKYLGVIIKYKDANFWKAKEKFESLNKKKDLSQVFVLVKNEEYFKKFYEYYDGIDLDELKKENQKFSINNYDLIKNMIKESTNQVIYSKQVLNSPNLTDKYTFWNIENALHIHSGNIQELAEILQIKLDWNFKFSNGQKFNTKKEFLDEFKHKHNITKHDVKLQNDDYDYFISWDA